MYAAEEASLNKFNQAIWQYRFYSTLWYVYLPWRCRTKYTKAQCNVTTQILHI